MSSHITPEVLRNIAVDAITRALGGVSVGNSWAVTSLETEGPGADLVFTLGNIYESAPYNLHEKPYDTRQQVHVAIAVVTPEEKGKFDV